jgi:hypothetical protein
MFPAQNVVVVTAMVANPITKMVIDIFVLTVKQKESIIIDIGYGGPPHGGMYRSTVNAVEGSPVYLDK